VISSCGKAETSGFTRPETENYINTIYINVSFAARKQHKEKASGIKNEE
jgi:hypothetical protein